MTIQINQFSSIQNWLGISKPANTLTTTPATQPSYTADSISLTNPTNSTAVPASDSTSFFNKPGVRLAGMTLASGVVLGGIGAGIGAAIGGRVAMGAAIGGGIGVALPLALVLYGLHKMT